MQAYRILLGMGLALALTGLQAQESEGAHAPVAVSVNAGQISVSEDPVSTSQSESGLVWAIATDGFRFAQNGIDIATPGVHDCRVTADGQRVHCRKLRHVPGAKFKYTVNVVDTSGQSLPPLDPFILHK
jgi:hypothetical protein